MCFTDDQDYEWTASTWEESPGPATKACHCDECGAPIAIGDWCHNIHAEEHDCCQKCEDEWSDSYVPEDKREGPCEHDYGETMDYVRCEACDKVIRAIEAVEIEEGCPPGAQRPAINMLAEELSQHSSAPVYAERAVAMFPEVRGCRILALCLRHLEA